MSGQIYQLHLLFFESCLDRFNILDLKLGYFFLISTFPILRTLLATLSPCRFALFCAGI